MDGYLYMLIIFLLIFKCSIYFCWYKARRERYLSAQRQMICTVQSAEGNTVYVQNAQGQVISPAAFQNQGLVERPAAPHYQHAMPTQDKPPAYEDITTGNNKTNQPPPPTYNYATAYPTIHGPTTPSSVPYPQTGPTSPGVSPCQQNTGPTSPGVLPYQQNTGPTNPSISPYPQMAYPYMTAGPNPGAASYGYSSGMTNPSNPTPN